MSVGFRVTMDAAQEVDTGSTSSATGLGTVVFDSTAVTATYSIRVAGLDFGPVQGLPAETPSILDDVTGFHVHNAVRGQNGSVVFGQFNPAQDIDDRSVTTHGDGSTTVGGIWETTDPASSSISNFAATLNATGIGADAPLYFNVHTNEFTGGAIRGQWVAISNDLSNNVLGTDADDWLPGLAGHDTLEGGLGADTLDGGNGDDLLVEFFGAADSLDGGAGTDTASITATAAADSMAISTAGDDVLLSNTGFADDLTLHEVEQLAAFGGGGNDTLEVADLSGTPFATGHITFDGEGGDDFLNASASTTPVTMQWNRSAAGTLPGSDIFNAGSSDQDLFHVTDESNLGGSWALWSISNAVSIDFSGAGTSNNGGSNIDQVQLDLGSGVDHVTIYHDQSGVLFTAVVNAGGGNDVVNASPYDDALGPDFFGQNDFMGLVVADGGTGHDTLIGGEGDDALTGGLGNDSLEGVEEADRLFGNEGNDTLVGGAGNDTLIGHAANDSMLGGSGHDNLGGGGGNDSLGGSDGNDTLFGHAGVDSLIGHAGDDSLNGGAGDDNLGGGSGNDSMGGSDGNDALLGHAGVDSLIGHAGGDILDGGAGDDSLGGGAGHDTLVGGAGADTLTGHAGIDTADYSGSGAGVTVRLATAFAAGGDAAGDVLSLVENLAGSAFADELVGDGGVNSLFGNGGNDTLVGGASNDTLIGNAGNDSVRGSAGDDSLGGGAGNDTLIGGAGADTLTGHAGIDTADYSGSGGGVTVRLATTFADGADAVGDVLSGIESLTGSSFGDELVGDGGVNLLDGGAGDDRLGGGAGNDTLVGAGGDDILVGHNGNDVFVFGDATGHDRINDFAGGAGIGDVIDLSGNSTLNSFADVQAAASQIGADTVIDMGGGGTLTLATFTAANLAADDFVF